MREALEKIRYFIDTPAGCEERFTAVSPYNVEPSSSVEMTVSVVVAQVVPPSRETAALKSVFKAIVADDVAANRSFAIAGEVDAVKVFEMRRVRSGSYRTMTTPEPPEPPAEDAPPPPPPVPVLAIPATPAPELPPEAPPPSRVPGVPAALVPPPPPRP